MKSLPYRGMEYIGLCFSAAGVYSGTASAMIGVYDGDAVMAVTGLLTGLTFAGLMKHCFDQIYEPSRKAATDIQGSMKTIEALVELSRQNMARLERIALGNLKN